MIVDNFVGFVGTVVDIDGKGDNFGKVKIRILGDQGENVIADDDLLWASVMMPATSAAETGIGTTPNWLVAGSTVVGYFLDGKYRNIPMIVGTLNQDKRNGHGISGYADGQYIQRNLTNIEYQYGVDNYRRPNYKDNKVITTASKDNPANINHIIELDDTPQSERILVKHKNGSYVEFLPNGAVVAKGTDALVLVSRILKLYSTLDMVLQSDNTIALVCRELFINSPDKIDIRTNELNITAPQINIIGSMTLNGRPVATT